MTNKGRFHAANYRNHVIMVMVAAALISCAPKASPERHNSQHQDEPRTATDVSAVSTLHLNPLGVSNKEKIISLLKPNEASAIKAIGWISPAIVIVRLGTIRGTPAMGGVRVFQCFKDGWRLIASEDWLG